MNLQVIKNRILSWTKKFVLYGIYFTIVFVTLSYFILQIPAVQQGLVDRYLSRFSNVTGFTLTVKRFHLSWYDKLELQDLQLIDPNQNTMIAAHIVRIDFKLSSLLKSGNINIDGVYLEEAKVNLITIDSADNLNINIFIDKINEQFSSGSGGGQSSAKVNIGEVVLDKSQFSYNDTKEDSIKDGFDYQHMQLAVDDGDVSDFKIIGDTIQFNVNSMDIKDRRSDFTISELQTYFRISQSSMEFLNLQLKAGQSFVSDTIIFQYKSMDDLSDFNDKVNIKAKLRNTVLYPNDLALFTYGLPPLPQPLHVSGELTGKVSRFSFQHMNVAMGNTKVSGKLRMDGLPSLDETFIDLSLKKGDIYLEDLKFLFPDNVYTRLKPLGNFQTKGEFTGFINDFVANGDFKGKLGEIRSDINLKINPKAVNLSTFSGSLETIDFDLGRYFDDTTNFQKVTLKGNIKGKGLTEETTDFFLSGHISSLGFRKYKYSNIHTDARFTQQLFSGKLTIDDPNLKFAADGSIDFRKDKKLIKVKANLDTLLLHNLGFINDYLSISTYADIDTQGLELDSLFGKVILKNSKVTYKQKSLSLDSVYFISEMSGSNKTLKLRSSLADINMEGNYYYSSLFNDLSRLVTEFSLNIRNDKQAITRYYLNKTKSTQAYDATFQVSLHDINPLIDLAGIDLSVSKGTKIDGKFSNGYTSVFQAFSHADTIGLQGKLFLQNDIEFSGSKVRDSTNILAALTITSQQQLIAKSFKTKNLFAEGIWNGSHINVSLDADQEGATNQVRLKSEIDFLSDSTRFKILPSKIKILEEEWAIDPQNYALVKGGEWDVRHLAIHHDKESIILNGQISKQPDKSIGLKITELSLDVLNTISTEKFTGVVNGEVQARDIYNDPYLQNNISISDMTIDGFLIGDVNGTNVWNRETRRFDITLTLDRIAQRTVTVDGFYDPSLADPLNLNAKLENTNIKIIEPFMKGIFSKMDGELTGEYKINGTFTEPLIKGEGKIASGKIMIDYLNTLYTFSGSLGFQQNQILFKKFVLTDALKNKGTLDGTLNHSGFSDFRINIDAVFKNFQVLNTTARDNSLFYGQAYASGSLKIFGPVENLNITATAKSEKNTRIFIPLSTTETIEKKDFISFVNFKDTLDLVKTADKAKAKKYSPSGITMELNLDITPDAYAEIIFNIKTGDIIRGYGNGDIKLQIDTKGDFNMFGEYEFVKGNYNFTLYDIINKEFVINKGSRITWYGDPYTAILNVNASYKQLASFAPIISNQAYANAPQMKRKYPVEVVLKMDGPILASTITFDIVAKNLPNNIPLDNGAPSIQLNLDFSAFKAKLDEQELKKQVFSLIVLRRFSPTDAFTTNGSLTSSVSELLSNQLSYWLTQVDQNLEFDFDLGTMDQESFNTFQLRLSYSFLNGRLHITRDGTFNNQYHSDAASMVGDWTIDYLLTSDGKFKVKMYNRTNVNQLTASLNTPTAITTGVSLMHTQNFNHWRDLIISARERRRRELEEQHLEEEKDENEQLNTQQKDGTH